MAYLALYWFLAGLAMQGLYPYPKGYFERSLAFATGGLFWVLMVMRNIAGEKQ